MEEIVYGLVALVFTAIVLVVIALSILYSDKLWYRIFPPRCERCRRKGDIRPYCRDYDPRDPGSLSIEFLCPECRTEKDKEEFERWGIGRKKRR